MTDLVGLLLTKSDVHWMKRCRFCRIGNKDPINGYALGACLPVDLLKKVVHIDLRNRNVNGRSKNKIEEESSRLIMVDVCEIRWNQDDMNL